MRRLARLAPALLSPAVALAQWPTASSPNLPIGDFANEQVVNKIAATADGGCYVGWFDSRNGGYEVRLQRFDAAGVEQWQHGGVLVSANPQSTSLIDWDLLADRFGQRAVLVPGVLVHTASVSLLVALAHGALALSERHGATADAYAADRKLLVRLEGAAADDAWTARAEEAEQALAALESQLKAVAGPGEAQAELQALLATQATVAGLQQPAVRSERAVPVEGLDGLLEVSARLTASGAAPAVQAILADLAARPWVRVERADIRDGSPGEVQMIVRGYYRQAGPEAAP